VRDSGLLGSFCILTEQMNGFLVGFLFLFVFPPEDADWVGLDSLAAHHVLGSALPQHVTGFVLPKPDAGETAADVAAVHAACQAWVSAAMTDLAAAAAHALSFVDGLTALAMVRDGLWRGLQPKANLPENVCVWAKK
jgi:hypothetical protein